jgi:hypothetical protein
MDLQSRIMAVCAHLPKAGSLLVFANLLFGGSAAADLVYNPIPGWNLLGNSSDRVLDVASYFGDPVKVASVWTWNASLGKWSFYSPALSSAERSSYAQSNGHLPLSQISPKEGFWVHASKGFSTNFPSTVKQVLSRTDLKEGWNLVANSEQLPPSQLNDLFSAGLAADGMALSSTWDWDTTRATWRFYSPSMAKANSLDGFLSRTGYLPFTTGPLASAGYWVHVAANTSAQGMWVGTTSTNRTVILLTLSDGTYYVFYSPEGNPNAIAGVIQGTGTTTGNVFSSNNARDFSLEGNGGSTASMAVNFSGKASFNGILSYDSGGVASFTTAYSSFYEESPGLAAIAGDFTGQMVTFGSGVVDTAITLSAQGEISGTGGGCDIGGTALARSDSNAYDFTFQMGPSPCVLANQKLSGVGFFEPSSKAIYIIAPTAQRTDGVMYLGTISGSTPTPVLSAMKVTQGNAIAAGTSQQLSAIAGYADGSTRDISASVTWKSSNPAVATVSSTGLVVGQAAGTATISATLGQTASTTVTITKSVSPPTGTLPAALVGIWTRYGATVTFQADGAYDFVSLYISPSSCLYIYRMETYKSGTASVSGSSLTLNTSGGESKFWYCAQQYDPIVPNSRSQVSPSSKKFTWTMAGNSLTLDDGEGSASSALTYTKQ